MTAYVHADLYAALEANGADMSGYRVYEMVPDDAEFGIHCQMPDGSIQFMGYGRDFNATITTSPVLLRASTEERKAAYLKGESGRIEFSLGEYNAPALFRSNNRAGRRAARRGRKG